MKANLTVGTQIYHRREICTLLLGIPVVDSKLNVVINSKRLDQTFDYFMSSHLAQIYELEFHSTLRTESPSFFLGKSEATLRAGY